MTYVFLLVSLLVLWKIEIHFRKSEILFRRWFEACIITNAHIRTFDVQFNNDSLCSTQYSSFEEIETINPYRAAEYKRLLRNEHVALIVYFESDPSCIDEFRLLEAWVHVQDDRALSDRICNLISIT